MQGRLNSHARPAASRAAATRTPTAGSAAGSPSACGSSLLSVTLAEAPCQPSVHGHRDAPHPPADVVDEHVRRWQQDERDGWSAGAGPGAGREQQPDPVSLHAAVLPVHRPAANRPRTQRRQPRSRSSAASAAPGSSKNGPGTRRRCSSTAGPWRSGPGRADSPNPLAHAASPLRAPGIESGCAARATMETRCLRHRTSRPSDASSCADRRPNHRRR